MKLNEFINEKQLNELAPLAALIPWGLKAATGAKAMSTAGAVGKATAGVIAKTAPKVGLASKIRQWTSKAPPDSSTPDALKNKGKQSVVEPKDKVAKPQGKLSPAANAAIARVTG
jgi:hypothetical protein